MTNEIKDVDIKIHTKYFFGDIISIKTIVPNKIKIDKKA